HTKAATGHGCITFLLLRPLQKGRITNGELECWLKPLDATGHGPRWLVEVFEKMGEDPNSDNYVKPENGDVWDFISSINEWASSINRKGIPVKI
ncbi:hypothetical protein, partial [Rheinheimera sp.]|uniref:hypothetical protein n=1 Tax=Rheinheimera sp. TaxID=1869214 RepID=UPI0040478FDF